ncbi:MAG: CotH kinase family protein [Prevotellaceae bacterium]|jgi:hypothetical protein|nr:CotH kinase family protein [Prevotellaceae bacterium]
MKKILFSLLILMPCCAAAQLKINEIMPNNVSAMLDEDWNFSMWVEVYNTGSSADNQSNYYFTDKLAEPKKWKPASQSIAAQKFSTLWFEREDFNRHANFKLDPEGGTLYLLKANGEIVDSVTYPAQHRNASYGRKTDGGDEWVFFTEPSRGASNNNKKTASAACEAPKILTAAGFYSGSVGVTFAPPASGETVYYTQNGSEPTKAATKYTTGDLITLSKTTCLRAVTVAADKLSSPVVTATYFVNARAFTLPVVSLSTDEKYLKDNEIGIYVQGTNGVPNAYGQCDGVVANWFRDWDRPVNFELFDVSGKQRLSQELDISIAGYCSRNQPQKGLHVKPKNKFGDNKLSYDFFTSKPGHKYKDIQMRASGTESGCSMMHDAFVTSIAIGRMNQDYLAYQPAVLFVNGEYYGIQNLRERSNTDFLYSNYGLAEDEVIEIDYRAVQDHTSSEYEAFYSDVMGRNLHDDAQYQAVCERIDIDSYMDYVIMEVYISNWDWPQNNYKLWKKKNNGKWRYILYDLDFGFGNLGGCNDGIFTNPWGGNGSPFWQIFNKLKENEGFRKELLARFCAHIATTFSPQRVEHILDSLSSKIADEMVYHRQRWPSSECGGFQNAVNTMRSFANCRPANVLSQLGNYFGVSSVRHKIELSSNTGKATYKFLSATILDDSATVQYYDGQPVSIEANEMSGYTFTHWEIESQGKTVALISLNDTWKYWDKNAAPAGNWKAGSSYDDSQWSSGISSFGYGQTVNTTISYGGNGSNKYTTAYFRKIVTLDDTLNKNAFEIIVRIDDGAVFYINGVEIYRYNLPTGDINYNTKAITAWGGAETVIFEVQKSWLKEGENVIAVEVHQAASTSSDLVFDLSLNYKSKSDEKIYTATDRLYADTLSADLKLTAIYEESTIAAAKKIYINEVSGNEEWIELYNAETVAGDLSNYIIRKIDEGAIVTEWNIPAGTTIDAKGFRTWTKGVENSFTWGISAKKDVTFRLLDNRGGVIDNFIITAPLYSEGDARTVGRITDGADSLVIFLDGGTKNTSNDEGTQESLPVDPPPVDTTQVGEGQTVGYPNPVVNNDLKIALGKTMTSVDITVYSLLGNPCSQQHYANTATVNVDLSHCPAGLLLLRIQAEGEKDMVKRVLKL